MGELWLFKTEPRSWRLTLKEHLVSRSTRILHSKSAGSVVSLCGSAADFIKAILSFLLSLLQMYDFHGFANLTGGCVFFFFKHWSSGFGNPYPTGIHLLTKRFVREVKRP